MFSNARPEPWDEKLFVLETRAEVRAYCRHNFISEQRAEAVAVPLSLSKRGVRIRATKP